MTVMKPEVIPNKSHEPGIVSLAPGQGAEILGVADADYLRRGGHKLYFGCFASLCCHFFVCVCVGEEGPYIQQTGADYSHLIRLILLAVSHKEG